MHSNPFLFYLDVIVCGSIQNILLFFNIKEDVHYINGELTFLYNYTNLRIRSYDHMKVYLNFAKSICIKEDIEILWYRDSFVKLISDYSKRDYVYD